MLSVADLAPTLQNLLGPAADDLAAQTRFCRRRRAITGPVFVRTLVLGWLGRPDAPLESLLERAGIPASPQAWHARVGPAAGDLLERLLARAVGAAIGASPAAIPLLRRFAGVYAEDMTDLGPAGKALVRYELSGGRVESLAPLGPKASEAASSAGLPVLPAGSLRLADRGFFDAAELRRLSAAGVRWVTRVPTGAKVSSGGEFAPLPDWLAGRAGGRVDAEVRLCEGDPVAGRLTARRCPPAVAAERLRRLEATAKRKGRPVSGPQRVMCEWSVYFTDLPAGEFGPAELEVLYRCRWQVELLFKRFKSLGGVGGCRGRRPERVRVETLAKLLAAVVAEWVSLLGGGPLARTGPVGRQRRARASADQLARALGCARALADLLADIASAFERRAKRRCRKSPSTRQLLFRPRLAA